MQGGGLKQEGLQWDGISRMGSADATQQEEGWDKQDRTQPDRMRQRPGTCGCFPARLLQQPQLLSANTFIH